VLGGSRALGDPEIGDLDRTVRGDQHIAGLHVAVQDPAVMRQHQRPEAASRARATGEHRSHRNRAVAAGVAAGVGKNVSRSCRWDVCGSELGCAGSDEVGEGDDVVDRDDLDL